MLGLRITVSPASKTQTAQLVKKLSTFQQRMQDRTTLMRDIKAKQVRRWVRNFSSQGAEYGVRWPGLSTRAVAERRRMGFGPGPILQRTGGLKSYVSSQSHAGQVDSTSISWTFSNRGGPSNVTGANYPLSHHFGTSNGVPARPIWIINAADGRRARLTTERWINDLMGEIFGS